MVGLSAYHPSNVRRRAGEVNEHAEGAQRPSLQEWQDFCECVKMVDSYGKAELINVHASR